MIRFWQKPNEAKAKKSCDFYGCDNEGEHPAPKYPCDDAVKNGDVFWFCVDHVRNYNRQWNFFRNQTEEQIMAQWKRDITWERPSWPLGGWFSKRRFGPSSSADYNDPFGVFGNAGNQNQANLNEKKQQDILLELFQLSETFTEVELQSAYRKLVKQFHPDIKPA